ncbi:MAG TPA: Ig-like domain-containing protein, partial [Lacibacter sp.]|nr:Ig-like domain-containing protein [Lacibacter sp.]
FYEGRVDLSDLGFTGSNLCNSSFLLETRSSQSITASLDDFVGGNFNITPPALILTGGSACTGNTGTITSTTSVSGASYQLFNSADQPVGPAKIGTGSGLTWTGIPIGDDYYAVGAGTLPVCTSTSNEVDVIGLANPEIADKSVCVGSTVDMGPDGTWSSSNTAVATINATTGVVTGVAPGTSTITYTNANGCTDQAIVTVNANPEIADKSVCVGNTVDMGPDGTWSSSNTGVATINATTGVVTGVAPGTSTITYSNGSNCSDVAIVTVNANPVVADKSVCVGSTVDMGPDGTWSSSNTAVATINATTGVVTGVAPGTSTITYTNANGCTDQAMVTVNPNTSSSQRREICANQLPYTWDGLTFDAGGSKSKTGLINQYGCDSTANYTLVVNPLPIISCSATPTLIDITSAAHNTQLDVSLVGNADTDPTHYTYVWTEDGIGSFNFNNIKNPVYTAGILDAGQTISFTVTVTNTRTGCVSVSNCSVQVNLAGTCPEVPTSEVCNGSTNTYTAGRAPSANETWKWTVNNSAEIVGADNGQSVTVTAGSQNFTLTLTVSYSNTELSPTVCEYEVTVVPCGGYCTYTQGKYGNTSPACDGDGIGDGVAITYPTVVDMIKAMLGVGGVANPLVVGSNGRTVTIPATASAATLLNKSMPGGGNARELLSGNCVVDTDPALSSCWTPGTNTSTTYITKQGRINNVLLSQTITLGLNLRVSGGLSDFGLQAGTFATAKADGGCGSTTPKERSCDPLTGIVTNEYLYKTIPQSIIDALDCKGYDHTVGGLYQLANDALGNADTETGKECGASLGDITNAVAAINEGFDECRISMGWDEEPLECVITSTRINITTSGAINNTDMSAISVESIRVSAYPNPFADKVNFTLVSPVSGKASLEVYNMFGQKLQTVFEGYLTAGRTQVIEFRPGSTAAAGTLIYKFNVAGKQVTGKLINQKQ